MEKIRLTEDIAHHLKLNPRASMFRYNGRIYLHDPATRTYAWLNEAMLALIEKEPTVVLPGGLHDADHRELKDIINQLYKLGILIESHGANSDKHPPTGVASPSLAIFLTTKCNLKCTYCYANGGDSGTTIRREIWVSAMDYFFSTLNSGLSQVERPQRRLNLIVHGGGEPTAQFEVLKDIVGDFLRRARAIGLAPSVSMGTNGTYNNAVHRWIIENSVGLTVSFDGPHQNRQRPYRTGRPTYDVVARNLKRLAEEGRSASIRATVTSGSLETMKETVEIAKELGVAKVHFEPVAIAGRCTTSNVLRPDAEQFAESFLKCFFLGLKLDIDVRYSGLRCFDGRHLHFCAACGNNFCVTPDGNVTTCYEVLDQNDPAASEFFIGRVDPVQGTVKLDQSRIQQLKQRNAENMNACEDCFLRYQCAGDCPVKGFRCSNGDIYSPDPYRCQIADRVNKQVIAWLADGVIEPRNTERARVISFGQILS